MSGKIQKLANKTGQVYTLQGEALKNWWQFWCQEPSLPVLVFLATLPFGAALLIYMVVSKTPLTPLVMHQLGTLMFLSFLVWLVMGQMLRLIVKEHQKRPLLITTDDSGITFKSMFKRTFVPWHEISDAYPTSTKEFIVSTKQGDFFFPEKMDRSNECFSLIKRRLQNQPEQYSLALLLREGMTKTMLLPVISVMVAIDFGILKPLLLGAPPNVWGDIIFLAGFNLIVPAITSCLINSLPSVLRIGPDGLSIRVGSKPERLVNWSAVTNIRNIGQQITLLRVQGATYTIFWRAYLPFAPKPRILFVSQKELKKQFAERQEKALELKNNFVQRVALKAPQIKLIG